MCIYIYIYMYTYIYVYMCMCVDVSEDGFQLRSTPSETCVFARDVRGKSRGFGCDLKSGAGF